MSLDEIRFNDLMVLYKKKNKMIREGDMLGLISLKNTCPEIFVKKNEMELDRLLTIVNYLREIPHFKAMLEEEKKSRLILVDHDLWRVGILDEVLASYERIYYAQIRFVSRGIVKGAVATCRQICQEHGINNASVPQVFPFLGLLLNAIIVSIPKDQRQHKIKVAMFKMYGDKEIDLIKESTHERDAFDEWKKAIPCYLKIEGNIKDRFQDMMNKVYLKFDQRKGFFSDLKFFCLIEIADFIGLIASNIGCEKEETKYSVLNKVEANITIDQQTTFP